MKHPIKLILMTSTLIVAFSIRVYCQDSSIVRKSGRIWKVSLNAETGYTTFALDDAHSMFDNILNYYRRIYIPLPSPAAFPGNMLIGGTIIFYSELPVRFGFGGYYSKTAIASSYQDYAGSLLERMDVNLVTFYSDVELALVEFPNIYIFAHPGICYSRIAYSEQINMTYPSQQSPTNSSSGYGHAYEGDFGLGFRIIVLGYPASAEIGYRVAKIDQLSDTEGNILVHLDVSGFILRTRIGIKL